MCEEPKETRSSGLFLTCAHWYGLLAADKDMPVCLIDYSVSVIHIACPEIIQ